MSRISASAPADDDSKQVTDRVRIFRRGKIWYANIQHEGRQERKSLKTTSMKEARLRAVRLDGQLDDNEHQPKKDTSVEEGFAAYKAYLAVEERAPKTREAYERILKKAEELAKRRRITKLKGMNIPFMDAYRAERKAAGADGKTIYTESVVVRQVINFALSRDMLQKDPM